jgi:hypothetical protein
VPLAAFLHLGASAIALGVAPFQLNSRLRGRFLQVHRWSGRVYVLCVLAGGVSGLVLAVRSQGGVPGHLGFSFLAIAWLFTTGNAYRHIRARAVEPHRRWMTRSAALTLAAVTLRIYLPVSLAMGVPFAMAYPAIAWLCWVPNLLVAELMLARRRRAITRGHLRAEAAA